MSSISCLLLLRHVAGSKHDAEVKQYREAPCEDHSHTIVSISHVIYLFRLFVLTFDESARNLSCVLIGGPVPENNQERWAWGRGIHFFPPALFAATSAALAITKVRVSLMYGEKE